MQECSWCGRPLSQDDHDPCREYQNVCDAVNLALGELPRRNVPLPYTDTPYDRCLLVEGWRGSQEPVVDSTR